MVTMGEVARHAGVSSSTVSHVINRTRPVNSATRMRVEQAIEQLGYRHNIVARALAAGRTYTVGLSISSLTNPYFGPLVHAIERSVTSAGYMLLIGDSHDEELMEGRVVGSLLDRRVDGMIVAPAIGSERVTLPQIKGSRTPLVLIDRNADVDCDQVTPENTESARLLTRHLLDLGRHRIAIVTGLTGLSSSSERFDGYVQALAERGIGIDERLVLNGESRKEAAEEAVRSLFSQPDAPRALVVMNNVMTIGALAALRDLGLGVPDDVVLVSFDDFEWSDLFEPRLTAMAQDVEKMGERAVQLLLDRMNGDLGPPIHVRVPTTFRHRDSCGCETSRGGAGAKTVSRSL